MSDISPIGRPTLTGPPPGGRVTQGSAPAAAPPRGDDKVELSTASQLLSKLAELPQVRQDVVDRVRAEIAKDENAYVSSDKIDAAISNLAEDLQ